MLVRNESSTITRCLSSVAPFIDSFCIFDTGSTDNTVDLIYQSIGHLPGDVDRIDFQSFSRMREILFKKASGLGDFVLIIDADESLQTISKSHVPQPGFDVGMVEVGPAGYCFQQPRILRSFCDVRCEGTFSETTKFPSSVQIMYLPHVRIHHHRDGFLHRNHDQVLKAVQCIDNDLKANYDPEKGITLAYQHLRLGNQSLARQCLEKVVEASGQDNQLWHAHYLLGLIYGKQPNGDLISIDHLQHAFELFPDRAEPLIQLAKNRIHRNDYRVAWDLLEVTKDIEIPIHHDYYERSLYEHERQALTKQVDQVLGRLSSGEDAAFGIEFPTGQNTALNNGVSGPESQIINQVTSGPEPRLTIGMATYDDYDGVYFSVMAILLYHTKVLENIEIIILDNHPGGPCSKALSALCDKVGVARYIPYGGATGTAVRDNIFTYARGDWVLCMDSHVMVMPGALEKLLDYLKHQSENNNLYQGPLVNESMDNAAFCMREEWRDGMLGVWENDPKYLNKELDPFEIRLQGLGLYCCKKSAWPGFNPRFSGFGGEEGYIHEKFRRNGGATICLPFLQWIHRFERPMGTRYQNDWNDRIRNYLIGHAELGMDPGEMQNHFSDYVGFSTMSNSLRLFEFERSQAFYQFDAIFCITHNSRSNAWKDAQKRFEFLEIQHRTQPFEIIETFDSARANLLHTQQEIIRLSQLHNYQSILIFEDSTLFRLDTRVVLNSAIQELNGHAWDVCFLGTANESSNHTPPRGCNNLVRISPDTKSDFVTNFCDYVIQKSGYEAFLGYLEESISRASENPDSGGNVVTGDASASGNWFSVYPRLTTRPEYLIDEEEPIRFMDPE